MTLIQSPKVLFFTTSYVFNWFSIQFLANNMFTRWVYLQVSRYGLDKVVLEDLCGSVENYSLCWHMHIYQVLSLSLIYAILISPVWCQSVLIFFSFEFVHLTEKIINNPKFTLCIVVPLLFVVDITVNLIIWLFYYSFNFFLQWKPVTWSP